nr:leucine zipper domain-containing protein [uncultured Microbacterium sp.]
MSAGGRGRLMSTCGSGVAPRRDVAIRLRIVESELSSSAPRTCGGYSCPAFSRLTPAGRLVTVKCTQSGRAVAHVAAEMGVSHTVWWRRRRFRTPGLAGD